MECLEVSYVCAGVLAGVGGADGLALEEEGADGLA